MSISDGKGPFIFCRKMETTRRIREEMDGKGAYFPPESEIPLWFLLLQVFFPICTLTWRVNIYVSRQGKGINKRNEITKRQKNYTDDINQ